jgi:hypothetical protein
MYVVGRELMMNKLVLSKTLTHTPLYIMHQLHKEVFRADAVAVVSDILC